MATRREHVFLSYCRENVEEVSRLRRDLLDAGERVWWDGELLPGQDWQLVIRDVMERCYAFVLCLSRECDERRESGIYPELRDAIEAYREMPPGSLYIIPVRLSECAIPPVKIDATSTLRSIQHVDLYPDERRGEGVRRLVEALRRAPLRP